MKWRWNSWNEEEDERQIMHFPVQHAHFHDTKMKYETDMKRKFMKGIYMQASYYY